MLQIELNAGPQWRDSNDWQKHSEQAARAALSVSSYGDLAERNFALEISIKLSNNDEVQELNSAYRGKDKPTNVLSFPLVPHDLLKSLSNSDDGEVLLGDVIMAHDVCASEAKAKSVPMADHATHLLIHGVLHLLGYDHETESDALIMEALEVKALQKLGIANPYNDQHI
ncbi:MAG: hypothetical protein Pars92KO_09290 [Parasphingorhabdus sp.]